MVIALFLAYIFPFELFLFSYIVLGPLHYMTELTWLKEKSFFTSESFNWRFLMLVAFFLIGLILIVDVGDLLHFFNDSSPGKVLIDGLLIGLIFSGILFASYSSYINSRLIKIIFTVIAIGLGFLFTDYYWFVFVIALIPTIIHTTIFTGTFVLEGALKNHTAISYVAFIVFILCNLFFFVYPYIEPNILTNQYVQSLFMAGDFFRINQILHHMIYGSNGVSFVLDSAIGTRIQGFIAFAYTYHYLNWFSKTEIIKWNDVPKKWLILSVIVWISSILLHLISIPMGILFITLLSTMHVFMEFPLNHRSFLNVLSLLKMRISSR
jgi:hypothetical protein